MSFGGCGIGRFKLTLRFGFLSNGVNQLIFVVMILLPSRKRNTEEAVLVRAWVSNFGSIQGVYIGTGYISKFGWIEE